MIDRRKHPRLSAMSKNFVEAHCGNVHTIAGRSSMLKPNFTEICTECKGTGWKGVYHPRTLELTIVIER